MTLALQEIRVLDLTDAVSGPFASMLLASYGAEVIRVESRRHLGFRGGGGKGNDSILEEDAVDFSKVDMAQFVGANFARYNLDKLSVALNLTKPEGIDLFKRLVRVSDVVVDNLSFGVMQKWGFDYDSLKQVKNDIIVASLPSLGKGPHENWTTWGMNLLSFTGFAYNWGHPDTPMEERSASSTYGDYIAGMMAVGSIFAALYHRHKTGEGQYIEVSQTEATASMLGVTYLDYLANRRVAPPRGNRHPEFAPYNCYRCKGDDRWCAIAVFNEDEWQQLCRALDSPEWSKDARFGNMEARLKNADELDRNIEIWTSQRTPHQVMKILQSFGVAAGAVQSGEDLYFDLQLRERGHAVEPDSGRHGNITFDGPPVRLSTGQKTTTDPAPILGEHNSYVYEHLLGLTTEEIETLTAKRVIF